MNIRRIAHECLFASVLGMMFVSCSDEHGEPAAKPVTLKSLDLDGGTRLLAVLEYNSMNGTDYRVVAFDDDFNESEVEMTLVGGDGPQKVPLGSAKINNVSQSYMEMEFTHSSNATNEAGDKLGEKYYLIRKSDGNAYPRNKIFFDDLANIEQPDGSLVAPMSHDINEVRKIGFVGSEIVLSDPPLATYDEWVIWRDRLCRFESGAFASTGIKPYNVVYPNGSVQSIDKIIEFDDSYTSYGVMALSDRVVAFSCYAGPTHDGSDYVGDYTRIAELYIGSDGCSDWDGLSPDDSFMLGPQSWFEKDGYVLCDAWMGKGKFTVYNMRTHEIKGVVITPFDIDLVIDLWPENLVDGRLWGFHVPGSGMLTYTSTPSYGFKSLNRYELTDGKILEGAVAIVGIDPQTLDYVSVDVDFSPLIAGFEYAVYSGCVGGKLYYRLANSDGPSAILRIDLATGESDVHHVDGHIRHLIPLG